MSVLVTRQANWDQDQHRLHAVRNEVFVVEQGVAPELEWDGRDEDCLHAVTMAPDGRAVAAGRLAPDGKIGRMAVLLTFRRQGLGGVILDKLVDMAIERGLPKVYLHAQSHAVPFYHRHGFVVEGEEFDEAGILHRRMIRDLETVPETRT